MESRRSWNCGALGGGGGLLPAPSREPSCSQADWSVISATTGGTGPLTVLLKPGPLAQHRGSYRPGMHLPWSQRGRSGGSWLVRRQEHRRPLCHTWAREAVGTTATNPAWKKRGSSQIRGKKWTTLCSTVMSAISDPSYLHSEKPEHLPQELPSKCPQSDTRHWFCISRNEPQTEPGN